MTAPVLINRYARALLEGAQRRGFDGRQICRSLTIDPDTVLSDELVFGPETMMRLVTNVRALLQDDFCGLTRRRCKFGSFDLMCELILPSATLGEALSKGVRFFNAVSDDIHFELRENGRLAALHIELAEPEMDRLHFHSEWWMLLWHRLACWLIGTEIPVSAVDFRHTQAGPTEEYAAVFSPNCRFGQPHSSLSFDRRFLDSPILREAHEWFEYRDASAIDLVSIPGAQRTFKNRIKSDLLAHFETHSAFLSMRDIAAQYHITTQTLRRRLDKDGVNFRSLKEQVRREAALKWLTSTNLSIAEIAERAGFSEPSALTRATKRWVGEAPLAYRQRMARNRF